MIALAHQAIDPAHLLADFAAGAGAGGGAIVTFTGIVRAEGDVEWLHLDHHDRLTDAALHELGAAARERFGLTGLVIVHRVGDIAAGQPIVFVAAAAAHRRAAFDAVDYVMDRLKTDVPLWKRETRGDGVHWIEARAADLADRARWEVGDGA